MYAKVRGSEIKSKLGLLVNGKATPINMRKVGSTLILQGNNLSIVSEEYININDSDDWSIEDITFQVDNSYNLIDINEDVTISVEGKIVRVSQESFQALWGSGPEDRIEVPISVEKLKPFPSKRFTEIITNAKSMDNVAKLLFKEPAPFVVHNNLAYIYYRTMVYVADIEIPDMSLTSSTAYELRRILKAKSKVEFYAEDGKLQLVCSDKSRICGLIRSFEGVQEAAIDNIRRSLSHIVDLDFTKERSLMETLVRTYSKAIVRVFICEDGMRYSIDGSSNRVTVGATGKELLITTLNIQMINVLMRIYGDSRNVRIMSDGFNFIGFVCSESYILISK